jgi:hypothetical protein
MALHARYELSVIPQYRDSRLRQEPLERSHLFTEVELE